MINQYIYTAIQYDNIKNIPRHFEPVAWLVRLDCLNLAGLFFMNPYKNLDQTKHGLHKHPLHAIWINIRQRCNNPNHKRYNRYGGRGIKVCDEWNDFKCFYDWAILNQWCKGLQIDRINNDLGYNPSNCRIVTPKINSNNRRDTVYVTIHGERIPLSIACDRFKADLEAVRQYIRRSKKSFEEVINRFANV